MQTESNKRHKETNSKTDRERKRDQYSAMETDIKKERQTFRDQERDTTVHQ